MLNIYDHCSSWVLASFLFNYKLSWKPTTLLALAMAKCCSHFMLHTFVKDILLHTYNYYFFLQDHTAIFVPASDDKKDRPNHLSPQIFIESHSSISLCPVSI